MSQPVDEGVVKYHAQHTSGVAPTHPLLAELDAARTRLFDLALVGAYADGIGYGNVSVREGAGCIISGTATGGTRVLGPAGYCRVQSFDLARNSVQTHGPLPASSESMTHCAVYLAQPQVQCVLHVHQRTVWQRLLQQGHKGTAASIPYGTPHMAQAMAALVRENAASEGLLVMAGHEEGIVAYGASVAKALAQIEAVLTAQPSAKDSA